MAIKFSTRGAGEGRKSEERSAIVLALFFVGMPHANDPGDTAVSRPAPEHRAPQGLLGNVFTGSSPRPGRLQRSLCDR